MLELTITFLMIIGVVFFALAFLGSWIAEQKNRPRGEGFALALCLGPLGLIIESLLPTLTKEQLDQLLKEKAERGGSMWDGVMPAKPPPLAPPDEAEMKRIRAAKLERARRVEEARKRQEGIRRLQQEKLDNAIGFVFGFGWFRAMPDWMQSIFIGVGLAIPVVAVIAIVFRW